MEKEEKYDRSVGFKYFSQFNEDIERYCNVIEEFAGVQASRTAKLYILEAIVEYGLFKTKVDLKEQLRSISGVAESIIQMSDVLVRPIYEGIDRSQKKSENGFNSSKKRQQAQVNGKERKEIKKAIIKAYEDHPELSQRGLKDYLDKNMPDGLKPPGLTKINGVIKDYNETHSEELNHPGILKKQAELEAQQREEEKK